MSAFGPNVSGPEQRRTTRVKKSVPITVTGIDALSQPFRIDTYTVSVSCHGCKHRSKHYIPKKSIVTIEIPCAGFLPRTISGCVVWVQRPRTVNQEFQIGVEFDTPQNVWGIASPPEDWLPFCKDHTPTVPSLGSTITPVVKIPVNREFSSDFAAPPGNVGQVETTVIDIANLPPEAQDVQLQEMAINSSIQRMSESIVREVVQQLTHTLPKTIADKVSDEVIRKLDAKRKRER